MCRHRNRNSINLVLLWGKSLNLTGPNIAIPNPTEIFKLPISAVVVTEDNIGVVWVLTSKFPKVIRRIPQTRLSWVIRIASQYNEYISKRKILESRKSTGVLKIYSTYLNKKYMNMYRMYVLYYSEILSYLNLYHVMWMSSLFWSRIQCNY